MIGLQELPQVRKNKRLSEYESSSNLSAAFMQSWQETPISSIIRDRELRLANIGQGEVKYKYTNPLMGQDIDIPQTEERKQLTKEQVESQIKESGLSLKSPDEGYTQEALNIIIERKREEVFRADQISRSKGFISGAGEFSVAVAAQLLDPINVASAFVPVIGPAKYSAMLTKATTRLGRAGVRAKVGAVEGLVGAAIVEPLIYRAMTREQSDYDMYNSTINIALGGAFGAGLHSGAGAIADAISKGVNPIIASKTAKPNGPLPKALMSADIETRYNFLKTAIAQEGRGVTVDVVAMSRLDPKLMEALEKEGLDIGQIKTMETTVRNEVKRGSDIKASIKADEDISLGEIDINQELEELSTMNDELVTMYGMERESYELDDELIAKAETDAKALEAALTCRLSL